MVEKSPDKAAIVFENDVLTYRQLEDRSNQLAHYLRNQAAPDNALIGLSLDRSFDMIIGILAILKRGGAYVPLDPSYPLERLRFMVKDSQLGAILTSSAHTKQFQFDLPVRLICVDKEAGAISQQLHSPLSQPNWNADSLAYVIYTSGSTGQPKGTMLAHRGLIHLIISQQEILSVTPEMHFLQFASLNFDASVLETFVTLCSGGTLVLATQDTLTNPDSFVDLCRQKSVDTALLPPSLLPRLRPEDLPNLHTLIVGGESCPVEMAQHWSIGRRLFNAYGPTEATVVATMVRCEKGVLPPVIGKPIQNLKAYVLDRAMEPLPPGAIGELYLGGVGLARGYLGKPGLTAEKFVPDPFSRRTGSRIYRTGDLARWRPDGRIEFCGRTDEQVKVRGHRIELGEIEAHLLSHPHIQQCAVTVSQDQYGEKRLAAYVVQDGSSVAPSELKAFIEASLPTYMVPSTIMELDALPLTRNGKIDRRALPAPDLEAIASAGEFVQPATETERRLAGIWKEVLHLERISTSADFFSIGGHSLLAATTVSLVKDAFQIDLKLIDFFRNASIERLGRIIDSQSKTSNIAAIAQTDERSFYPCTSAQRRMYILNNLDETGTGYNIPIFVRVKGTLERVLLENVFEKLVQRHEALRTHFHMFDGEVVQVVDAASSVTIEFLSTDEDSLEHPLKSFIRPFDLSKAPLWRIAVYRLSPTDHILAIDAHHIVLDGVSLLNLVREFGALYEGVEPPVPSLRQKDFAVWQMEKYLPLAGKNDEEFWLTKLQGELPVLELPTDFPRPSVQSFRGSTYSTALGEELTSKLKSLAEKRNSTLFFTLLGIYKILLHKYTGQDDIIVGIPVAGRPHHDLNATVGMFVNTLAIRSVLRSELGAAEFLDKVKHDSLLSIEHQLYPLETLIEKLNLQRDTSRNPLFSTIFSMFEVDDSRTLAGNLELTPFELKSTVSKFDLSMSAFEQNGELHIAVEYCGDLFEQETIKRICQSFQALCEGICDNPNALIREVNVLSTQEESLLRSEFGRNPRPYDYTKLFIDFFRDSVRKYPKATAVIDHGETLTYEELDRRSEQLALLLREKGACLGDRIAVLLRRSAGAVTTFLAVLKAHCVYVPMDPFVPPQRIAAMLSDCEPLLLISDSAITSSLQQSSFGILESRTVVCVNEVSFDSTGALEFSQMAGSNSPQDDAYIIYTSGSTGTPKGTRIPHSSLAHYVQAYCDFLGYDHRDRTVHLASLSFDASIEEIAAPLYAGASICVFEQRAVFDIDALVADINEKEVTLVAPSPLLVAELIRRGPYKALRLLTPGGDTLQADHVQGVSDNISVWNLYGPTEATISSCGYRLAPHKQEGAIMPIGRPFPNYDLYVLDKSRKLVPIGVPGELYIGGPGLSSGYLNRPSLNAQKFVSNPFKPGERMYATGDLAKWGKDGNLLFLGRMDRQVQIRGFRVELQEIETSINKIEGIDNSIVLDIDDAKGMKQLVCYYTSKIEIPTPTIRGAIARFLPKYMVPDHYVHLAKFPVMASGKIDVKQLPALLAPRSTLSEWSQPRDSFETKMHKIWQDVLGLEGIDIHASFFELGGNSLRLIQLNDFIAKGFDQTLPLVELFNNPTIAGMAQLVSRGHGKSEPPAQGNGPNELLLQDAVLDPAFRAERPPVSGAVPSHIFLTGATGFLGAQLVRDLLVRSDASIYCLVRCRSTEEGLLRLERSLGPLGKATSFRERLRIVPGDLGAPRLGLSVDQYAELAERLDCVVHNGAAVNAVYNYSLLRASNVLGTRECLEIARAMRGKPFHYISTASVLEGVLDRKDVETTCPAQYPVPTGGYAQTKWIGEVLASQASDRGLPVFIYRPGRIVGHSETGLSNPDDLLVNAIRSCLRLGCAPDVELEVDMSPVDAVSEAIIGKVLNWDTRSAVFDLSARSIAEWTTIMSWLQEHFPGLSLIPAEQWLEKLERAQSESTDANLGAIRAIFGGKNSGKPDRAELDFPLGAGGSSPQPMRRQELRLLGPAVDKLAVSKWLKHWQAHQNRQ
ncbi:MAG: amino acid adenylation domain-containing protein [Myxococcota bacterium]|nr:amino acid adenylation domain-containing protein [Myxococcota bacterium]